MIRFSFYILFACMFQLAYGQTCKKTLSDFKSELQTFRNSPEVRNFEPLNGFVWESKNCGLTLESLGSDKGEVDSLQRQMFKMILDNFFEKDKIVRDPERVELYPDLLKRAELEGFLDDEIRTKIARNYRQAQVFKAEFLQKRKEDKISNCLDRRNFSDQLPPVRNQSINGWCYAYTASDLLTFKLKQNVSPIDLAFGSNQMSAAQESKPISIKDVVNTDGGTVKEAILSREKVGFCRNEDFDLGPGLMDRIIGLGAVENLESLVATDEQVLCENFSNLNNLYKNLNLEDFKKILETSMKNELLENLRNSNCRERIKPFANLEYIEKTYGKLIGTTGDKDLLPDITDELLKSLKEGRIVSIGLDIIDLLKPQEGKSSASHAMVVIGNEMNSETGQCDFIVRNSWGEDCSAFNEEVKCDKGILKIPQSYLEKSSINTTEIK